MIRCYIDNIFNRIHNNIQLFYNIIIQCILKRTVNLKYLIYYSAKKLGITDKIHNINISRDNVYSKWYFYFFSLLSRSLCCPVDLRFEPACISARPHTWNDHKSMTITFKLKYFMDTCWILHICCTWCL